jgi:hypothetical protein
MSSPSKFLRLGDQTVFLWGYEWLMIENFAIANPIDQQPDLDLLRMFIEDRVYEVSYQTSRANDTTRGIHGPLLISKIAPSSFNQLTREEFRSRVAATLKGMPREYYSGPEHDTGEQEAWRQLTSVIGQHASYFELSLDPADPSVHHEFWKIVSPFHEFIVTNQNENRVSICVFAGD